jgi:hypothetical protein
MAKKRLEFDVIPDLNAEDDDGLGSVAKNRHLLDRTSA